MCSFVGGIFQILCSMILMYAWEWYYKESKWFPLTKLHVKCVGVEYLLFVPICFFFPSSGALVQPSVFGLISEWAKWALRFHLNFVQNKDVIARNVLSLSLSIKLGPFLPRLCTLVERSFVCTIFIPPLQNYKENEEVAPRRNVLPIEIKMKTNET